jgi:cobalt-precorrin 5A hydrolase/precorrin-3B C17-methyltransferase
VDGVAAVRRAIAAGQDVLLIADVGPPVELPPGVRPDAPAGSPVLWLTDRAEPGGPDTAVMHPPTLVVGVGSSRGVAATEVGALIDRALAEAGLAAASVRHLATVDLKADEAGILAAAAERGWPVVCHPATALAEIDVPNPSEVVRAVTGTPSVAEAAALCPGPAELVVAKHRSAMATVAVARHPLPEDYRLDL